MKDTKIEYQKPKSINEILLVIRGEILHQLQIGNDRRLWKDVNKDWANKKTNYTNKSKDNIDRKQNRIDDIIKISQEIIQVSNFDRILTTDEDGQVDNYPRNTLPYFMKQTIGAKEKDLYNINSQKVFMMIDEKKLMLDKSMKRHKNRNLNQIRKVVSHHRQKVKSK